MDKNSIQYQCQKCNWHKSQLALKHHDDVHVMSPILDGMVVKMNITLREHCETERRNAVSWLC